MENNNYMVGTERKSTYKIIDGVRVYYCKYCKYETKNIQKIFRHQYKYGYKPHENIINIEKTKILNGYCKYCDFKMKNPRDIKIHNLTKKHRINLKKHNLKMKESYNLKEGDEIMIKIPNNFYELQPEIIKIIIDNIVPNKKV